MTGRRARHVGTTIGRVGRAPLVVAIAILLVAIAITVVMGVTGAAAAAVSFRAGGPRNGRGGILARPVTESFRAKRGILAVPVGRWPLPAPQDTGRPAVTLLYQNFPNPFPTIDSRTTCIWFDLNRSAAVKLTVHDIRGNLVRQLLPTASSPPFFSPGRYGRASPSSGTGCDPAFTWDGRADDGTVVPRGVYLIRLRAGGTESIKKAVFQGT